MTASYNEAFILKNNSLIFDIEKYLIDLKLIEICIKTISLVNLQ